MKLIAALAVQLCPTESISVVAKLGSNTGASISETLISKDWISWFPWLSVAIYSLVTVKL